MSKIQTVPTRCSAGCAPGKCRYGNGRGQKVKRSTCAVPKVEVQ